MGNYYIVGTAGHIDHGKSSLIEKLTNINPDRLIEEKRRKMTIDLGFAHLYSNDLVISFVDVPGHASFIKNMITGAIGFDLCLMAIDCVELIKPQTIEHTNIISLLGVKNIVIAITKCDKIATKQFVNIKNEIKPFFESYNFKTISILPVSIFNNASILNLKKTLIEICKNIPSKKSTGPFLLYVDRKFSIKGFGTVVTGTALEGSVRKNNILEHLPSEKLVKIKNIQIHNKYIELAQAGARVAINISNININDIDRGDLLCTPHTVKQVDKVYAYIKVFDNIIKNVKIINNKIYPIYIGTGNLTGRVVLQKKKYILPGFACFSLIYFNRKYPIYFKQPFIIRGYNTSIGGGYILSTTNYELNKDDLIKTLENLYKDNERDDFITSIQLPEQKIIKNTTTHDKNYIFENGALHILKVMKEDIKLSNATLLSEKLCINKEQINNYLKFLHNKALIIKIDEKNFIEINNFKDITNSVEELIETKGYIDIALLKKHIALPRKFLMGILSYLDKSGKYYNKDNKRYKYQ